MNQHSIPQNVTSYQFRLIGDMTIKQFIFLSIGIAGAIFFYYTNLFSLIKWFFILVSGLFGVALAFMPLEERPLDQWLVNYVRAIYKPTRFLWRKQPDTPKYFNFTSNQTISPSDSQELARAATIRRQQGLHSYLITLGSDQEESPTDTNELARVTGVLGLFAPLPAVAPESPGAKEGSPVNRAPNEVGRRMVPDGVPATLPVPFVGPTNAPVAIEHANQAPNEVGHRMVPDGDLVDQAPSSAPATVVQAPSDTLTTQSVSTPAVAATSSSSLPFPSSPTSPNTLVGMILDSTNKIVEGAIVEVIDESGLPVRATKTNQLGQFFSTTPLKRGVYRLTVEKTGLTFDTIEIALTGQIVNPLKIQAK